MYLKGLVHYNIEDYYKAVEFFNEALKLNPNYLDALDYKAQAFIQLKEYKKAIKEFDSILKIDPENIKAFEDKKQALNYLKEK